MSVVLANTTDNIVNIDNTGGVTISSIISSLTAGNKLTKGGSGAGTLTLSGVNTYSGDTTISSGKLALSGSATIASTPAIRIAASATFDIAALTASTFTLTGSSPVQTLACSSGSGTATITATSKTIALNSGALLTFVAVGGGSPTVGKISVTGGLTLNANAVTVNVTGSALGVGTYRLMDCTGTLANTGTFGTPTISGSGLAASTAATISVTTGAAGHIDLVVTATCTPPTDTLTGGATICAGSTASLTNTLTGTQPWSITWSDGVTSNGITTSPLIRTVTPSVTSNYTVTAVSDSTGCTPGTFSGSATVTVNPILVPGVGISASPSLTVCIATPQIIFTASPTNGGTPTYQWFTNGVPVNGATFTNYTNSTPLNGDTVYVQMTSTATCATPATTNSITNTINVTASVTPGVGLTNTMTGGICAGTPVIFGATPTNGGTPAYQWFTNNVADGGGTFRTYTNSVLANNDRVYVVMTSTDPCASPATANSITNTISVTSVTTPTVGITASPGVTVCSNSSVTFAAWPTNGGATPTYQWRTNGVIASGATSSTYSYTASGVAPGSYPVSVVLTPSGELCSSPAAATNSVTLTVNANVAPSVSIAASPGLTNCAGTEVVFTATPVNGGVAPSYQWKTNNVNVGVNSTTYTNSALVNATVVTCVLTPSSEICVSSAKATNTVTVAANQFSLPGASTTIFSENMGTPGGTTTLAANVWQNGAPITFGSTAANAPDVRATIVSTGYTGASGNGNVFFTSTTGARNLVISNINTLNYSSIAMQFGLKAEALVGGDPFVVEVSADGASYTALTFTQPTTTTGWALFSPTGTIPSTSNLRLRFSKNTTSSWRLDDVKLTGSPLTPTNATITASGPTAFNYGGSVTLTALAGGTSYLWSTAETTQAITVTNSGTYTVTITDSRGCTSSASTNVTVINPAITSQPVNVTNAPTTDVSFTVAAVGSPTLTYQWQHAGTNLPGAQSATLNLTAISFINAGSYTAVVSNGLGNAVTSSVATLTLIDPAILAQPVSRTNNYGTTATFSVTGASASALSYQWRTNGVNLPEGGQFTGTAANSLSVSSVAFANAGNYTVVVTSSGGSVTSSVAVLTVNDPIITSQPANQTNAAGTTASFTVTAAGTATVGYQWQRAGTNVPSATSATLSLPTVSQIDATNGNYTVIVSGVGLSVTSSPVTLTVVDPPVVTTPPASRTNNVGDRTVFTLSSSGTLKSYQWRHNNADISGAISINYTNAGIAAADAGNYDVIITNLAGTVTSTPPAVLTVIGSNAVKVAQWNFNSTSPDTDTGTGATTPSTGSGTAALVGSTSATFAGGSSSDPASSDNSRWSTASYPAQGAGEKTAGVEFAVSTVGYTNVIVSWEQQGSAGGSKYAMLRYSTDGSTFLDTPKFVTVTGTSTHQNYDFSGTAGVANNANFKFRIVTCFETTATGGGTAGYVPVSTTYGAGGTEGFDLVTLFAQPFPTITTQPQSTTNCPGSTTFTAAATGSPTPTAQWQVSTDSGATWNNIGGATADAYNFTAVTTDTGKKYHVVYSNPYLSATSSVATLTVYQLPTANNVTYSFNLGSSSTKIGIADLLTNDASAAVGTINLASVANSTNSVTVTKDATYIYYSGTLTANDRFDYTITNGCGASASGYVLISAVTANGQQDGSVRSVTFNSGTGQWEATMNFFGVPSTQYHVQRAASTDVSFAGGLTILGPVTANPSVGAINYVDTNAPSAGAFYRLTYP